LASDFLQCTLYIMALRKKALILGITGQDGAYLSRLLIDRGYEIHGVRRRSSSFNTGRIDELIEAEDHLHLYYGDITDAGSLISIISEVKPHEIYNLAAQSHVAVSFVQPTYTIDANALGVSRLLECIRASKLDEIRLYQASTSEMFGSTPPPQNEESPLCPQSPYGASKVLSYWLVVQARESYGLFASNGILFNHESPLRGGTFVSKKIVKALVRRSLGNREALVLGNLYSQRDWGHARDYVEAQWLMLQISQPRDFVISTGQSISVKEFATRVSSALGNPIYWEGSGMDEKAIDKNDEVAISVSEKYFRPLEVDNLRGDSSLAKKILGWEPKTGIDQLIDEMVSFEMSQQLGKKPTIKWLND
jgi:GDPmannose 4,6-dehydratase